LIELPKEDSSEIQQDVPAPRGEPVGAEYLNLLLWRQRDAHPSCLHFALDRVDQSCGSRQTFTQKPVLSAKVVVSARVRVGQDLGDLLEREIELAVEQDLLQARQIASRIQPIAGVAPPIGHQ
jgi:hypothetical protein